MTKNLTKNRAHTDGMEHKVPDSSAEFYRTGIVAALGELGHGALVDEKGLAKLLGCHTVSVKRAVRRRELPAPVKFMGRRTWTVGSIVRFVEDRLAQAAKEADIIAKHGNN